jgi:hypothetical protein
MHQKDSTSTNERPDDDLVHMRMRARASDKRTLAQATLRGPLNPDVRGP